MDHGIYLGYKKGQLSPSQVNKGGGIRFFYLRVAEFDALMVKHLAAGKGFIAMAPFTIYQMMFEPLIFIRYGLDELGGLEILLYPGASSYLVGGCNNMQAMRDSNNFICRLWILQDERVTGGAHGRLTAPRAP
ncbi:hypothetical protein GX48_05596 [Paracoccidioides brasiliensis]|nr:hypothetical protein GX48_05596 [Paracoccidioides brasiliensis]